MNKKKTMKNTSILDLNDDCLYEIYKYLEIEDRIILSKVCKRFEKIFIQFMKTTKTLTFWDVDLYTISEYKKILQKVGNYIERITLELNVDMDKCKPDFDFYLLTSLITQYAPNIWEMKISYIEIDDIKVANDLGKLQKLRNLTLRGCDLEEYVITALCKTPLAHQIEYLNLDESDSITMHIENFVNLKTLLVIEHVIEFTHLINITKNVKHLKELDISFGIETSDSSLFQAVADNLNELEVLTIEIQCFEFDIICKLKKLRSLTIERMLSILYEDDYEEYVFEKLINFAKKNNNQLTVLTLMHYKHNDKISEAILHFSNLKQLNLPVIEEFPISFVKNISKLKNLKILNFRSCGTFGGDINIIKDSILNLVKTSPNINFIDLSYSQHIDDEFILQIAGVLKTQIRKEPLSLLVFKTSVSKILQNEESLKIYYYNYEYCLIDKMRKQWNKNQ